MEDKISVYRKEHFNAAHRLHNPGLTDEENARIYGKCNNPNYHGHNYELVVKVTGLINETTGFLIDTKELSNVMKEMVVDRFDHKNLNLDVPEFKDVIPTAENMARVIYRLLRDKIKSELDLKVILYETERNFVEYPA